MVKTFKELKDGRTKQLEFLRSESLKSSRLAVGVNQEKALNSCLVAHGSSHLQGTTLLSASVRKRHDELMYQRLLRLARKSFERQKDIHEPISKIERDLLRKRIQFVTVLHEVCPLDLGAVRLSAQNLIQHFQDLSHVLKHRRFSCSFVGVVEIEIVNMRLMRQAHQYDDVDNLTSGRRKLKVLESMLDGSYKEASSVALVHCHGVIDLGRCPYEIICTELREIWNKSYQVEVKNLSDKYRGTHKSVESNLKDIASYITKGANDKVKGGISFHYKLSFEKDLESVEDKMVQDWRKVGSVIREESKSEGLEHPKSMTMAEIVFHAQAIDMLMGLKRNRMGYVIKF